jgi:cyclomaltodextrinase / maltogenic alpha-amylase / neopullulanase
VTSVRPRGSALALAAATSILAACTNDTASITPSAPPPSSSDVSAVRFDSMGGDAFAWSERVTGTSSCGDVRISVDGSGAEVPADMTGTTFRANVPLVEGANQMVASCTADGEASAPLVFDERLPAGPTAHIGVDVRGTTVVLDGSSSEAAAPDGAKVVGYAWHEDPRHPSALTTTSGEALRGSVKGEQLDLRAPSSDGEYYVSLTVTDAKGRTDTSTTYFVVRGGVARPVDMMHEHPAWIDSAVIYAPIPLLWGNGGPRAIDRRLPYLKKLGIDALWLWPPSEQRATGEEYAITDYFALDDSWGPPAAFRHMVDDAHKLGMHVMLDIVPNHMSDQSPYFLDTKTNGKASHYYDFFDRDKYGSPTHYFDWSNLPNLNYANPEVRAMITEAFVHWVRDYGIDGFRVDAAWGVERRRPTFWPELRRAVKRVDPDVLMLAEASAVDPYYFSHGFDAAYDWTHHPGQWAWTSAFDFPTETGALLTPAITNDPNGYASDAIVLRFINNNDTGVRFVDQYGPQLTRVAATLQFTLPGIPAMFAGDEIGASYEPYSNLTPIPWKDRHHLLPLYERLIELHHTLPSLRSHDVDVFEVSADSALAYLRPAFDGGQPVLVLLNFGARQPKFAITATPALTAAIGNGSMRDLLTNSSVHLDVKGNAVSFPMGAESMYVLVPGGS